MSRGVQEDYWLKTINMLNCIAHTQQLVSCLPASLLNLGGPRNRLKAPSLFVCPMLTQNFSFNKLVQTAMAALTAELEKLQQKASGSEALRARLQKLRASEARARSVLSSRDLGSAGKVISSGNCREIRLAFESMTMRSALLFRDAEERQLQACLEVRLGEQTLNHFSGQILGSMMCMK